MIRNFEFHDTEFKDVKLINPFISDDERGLFVKDYSKEVFELNGIKHDLKEVFYTESYKGVIRAIHFQRVKEQAKLVRCISGHIYDVVVDLRPDSMTFGKWQGFELTGENHMEILIPENFGHGYLVLEDSIVSYKCAEKFYGEYDDGIRWNDPDINIQWPLELVDGKIILSEKDKKLQSFREFRDKYC
ncbi:MAG: dTDP-4-dehydrorhamnose 3,5-epimerase [Blautia sp.]|nr:dTDP-4-dehydrorhamnose 3,5-epimerase [Blautia sp.]MCM1200959.1 dTDP-4-dehydrorhamnose 3,5-epimerase [Bacteroides fragilis]